ncbi:MAG TPA: outer membrane lipoprotein carrier protein LolA [Candidatus Sulfotelmatobacter sp.]|nr:outer membrane lipoprotein carrier protein LolA [Candidatus Sulfotelmatobacter sp.]
MKYVSLMFAIALGFAALGTSAPKPDDSASLESVLRKMDAVSANFRSAQAEFEWDYYQRVIDETVDVQTGSIYYRRAGKDIEMMAEVKKAGPSLESQKPEPKYVLFSEGKVRVYEPKIDRVTAYDLGKDKVDLGSYVVLGFGGSGQDLQKSFDVNYQGTEKVGEVNAAKLQLIPKSEGVKKYYNRMILWIDPDRGVSVQQQFFTPQGDYRLCKYGSIKLGEKISDDVFRLKTTGKTQTISPRG